MLCDLKKVPMSRLFLSLLAILSQLFFVAIAQDTKGNSQIEKNGKIAMPPVVYLWPQIPFARGKDLCQYHDA